ncbi:hypothetical protein SAMN05216389_11582 [Oceanobacillus limi]|uniref:Uncharacterized protein n=1 Tax=Oceanobacillus limi TaxID=930131 RepID=A0A1I0FJ26_9BACI|nr:hypothetical protein [Oceanobacillus limi]SET58053.1 hypothetical protein SAMN05216389_11582 [Oceanobacillus limi]
MEGEIGVSEFVDFWCVPLYDEYPLLITARFFQDSSTYTNHFVAKISKKH